MGLNIDYEHLFEDMHCMIKQLWLLIYLDIEVS